METQTGKSQKKESDFQATNILEAMDFERDVEITVPIFKTDDVLPIGKSIFVKVLGMRTKVGKPVMDEKTGEWVDVNYHMLKLQNTKGDVFEIFADAGMRSTLEAFPQGEASNFIEIQRLEKVKLDAGRTCNQYKVYSVKSKKKN